MKYLILLLPFFACKENNLPDPMTRQEFNLALDSVVSVYELRLATSGKKEVVYKDREVTKSAAKLEPATPVTETSADLDAAIAQLTKTSTLTGEVKVIKDKSYPIWQGPKGGLFIIRVSGKTGLPYKSSVK
jgi:hypothetical protein